MSGNSEVSDTKDTIPSNHPNTLLDEEDVRSSPAVDDPFHYTKRDEFTSEIFKICVENLPYYVGYQVSIL